MKYTIGLDFGTLSVRAVLVDIACGEIVLSSVSKYKHGVMDQVLENNKQLPNDFALQDALDYIESMEEVIDSIIKKSKVDKSEIIGIGLDFTASTILPIKADGTPLSKINEFKNNPHAYVKLWKHHSAEKYAVKISELGLKLDEPWISRYGNKISSEWMLPKVFETLENAPKVFDNTDYFIEAGDFITYRLTGNLKRSSCMAGYKGIWHFKEGYPRSEYLYQLNRKLANIYTTKLSGDVCPLGETQGNLLPEIASSLKLNQIPVAIAVIDAHVAALACKAVNNGDMLMIIGI